ncbi:membrane hypothetical protein [Alteromonas sp. 38]|uniref:hypothetical protein n=1 Tax=unclassified Alteromonas TaxID=2614992 RepID=UPI0012F06532|nr:MULTISPECIES: hypothetical protein [unclassified Alteromonas]CAD5292402.1 membrane hypothetical protein [Alteromonas sp. 154]VXB15011.1 membrane hypothetical protein [Alteromonas sp. 38]
MISVLLMFGCALATFASLVVIYRALFFAFHTGSFVSALVGTILGAISLVFSFKNLAESANKAENNDRKLEWKKPLITIFFSVVGTIIAIYMAGLSVGGFFNYIANGFNL